jgi:hypothetical protein
MPWKRVNNFSDSIFGGGDLDIVGEAMIFRPGSEVPQVVHYKCGCKALIVVCSGYLQDFMPCELHYDEFRHLSYESASEIPSGN